MSSGTLHLIGKKEKISKNNLIFKKVLLEARFTGFVSNAQMGDLALGILNSVCRMELNKKLHVFRPRNKLSVEFSGKANVMENYESVFLSLFEVDPYVELEKLHFL